MILTSCTCICHKKHLGREERRALLGRLLAGCYGQNDRKASVRGEIERPHIPGNNSLRDYRILLV